MNLKEIDDFKREKGRKIEKYFWEEKEELLRIEKKNHLNTVLVPSNLNGPTKII